MQVDVYTFMFWNSLSGKWTKDINYCRDFCQAKYSLDQWFSTRGKTNFQGGKTSIKISENNLKSRYFFVCGHVYTEYTCF